MQPHAFRLARGLLALLPGRLWDGKEEVLASLVRVVTKCPEVVVVVEEEGREGEKEKGAWLLWEKGERSFPPALMGRAGGKEAEAEAEVEEEGAAMEVMEAPAALAPGEEAAEAASAVAATEARDEDEFRRIAEEDAKAEAAPTATAPDAAAMQVEGSGAGGGNLLSYHGLVRVLVAQCGRPHRDYRRAALGSLTELALAFPDADAWALAAPTLRRLAGEEEGAAAMAVDDTSGVGGGSGGIDHVLRARAVEALGALFPPVLALPGGRGAHATQRVALPWLLPALLARATYTVWSLRQAVFKALRRVAERVYVRGDEAEEHGGGGGELPPTLLTSAVVEAVVGACLQGVGDLKFHQVRHRLVDGLPG